VIEDMFYNEIFNELSKYVERNPDKLESNSYYVESPDEVTLSDFIVKWVSITSSEGNEIQFDVILSAEIEIAETVKRNRETDGLEQWFRISCAAILEDGLQDFGVIDVSIYMKQKEKKENRLSEYLVPIISKEKLDQVAETFLKKYYPEALDKPVKVPARRIAKRMGLKVHEVHITQLGTIFGQIYFSDSRIKYYDIDTGTYKKAKVKRGTILIDPDVFFMRNIGSMNNTIIHECVHWDLHKKFFELEKLYNPEAKAISCRVIESAKPENNRTPLDWMEWQANALAPRILMPERQTRTKIEELIAKNKRFYSRENSYEVFESVVLELSEFFEVSKVAAKIRMIDLGYREALGVYTYVDDRYVASHSFVKEALKNNQTFSISIQDALFEYATNANFKSLVDSGKYLYVDAHFCINDPKYIYRDDQGYANLTDYARRHIDECCLIFDVKASPNNRYGVSYYKEAVLYRDVASDKIIEIKYSDSDNNISIDKIAKESTLFRGLANQIATIQRALPTTFGDALVSHMKRLNITEEELAQKSLVSPKTIQRMRNEFDYNPKLGTVIAICIGLQLPPPLSMDMVAKSGHSFRPGDQKHIIYQMLLMTKYQSSIYECNEILLACDYKTLAKEA
jgi:DNA-binding XRE family transcriptional regulator